MLSVSLFIILSVVSPPDPLEQRMFVPTGSTPAGVFTGYILVHTYCVDANRNWPGKPLSYVIQDTQTTITYKRNGVTHNPTLRDAINSIVTIEADQYAAQLIIKPAHPDIKLISMSTQGFIVGSSNEGVPNISIEELNSVVANTNYFERRKTIWRKIHEIESAGQMRTNRLNDIVQNSIPPKLAEKYQFNVQNEIIQIQKRGGDNSGGGGGTNIVEELSDSFDLYDEEACLDLDLVDKLLEVVSVKISGNMHESLPVEFEFKPNKKLYLCFDGTEMKIVETPDMCRQENEPCRPFVQGEICSEPGESFIMIGTQGDCKDGAFMIPLKF